MRTTAFLVAAGALQATASPIDLLESRQVVDTPCQNIHIFSSRGSNEGYTTSTNRINNFLIPAVCNGVSSCGYEDIVYPATLLNYCSSEIPGVTNAVSQITAYAQRCPNSQIVLAGYSQGAQVLGDALGGSGGNGACNAGNGALNSAQSPANKIKAIVFFGDARHTHGQAYNKGTASVNAPGIWPRSGTQLTGLNQFASKIASYCDAGDSVCASGSNTDAHLAVVEKNAQAAATFIKSKLS